MDSKTSSGIAFYKIIRTQARLGGDIQRSSRSSDYRSRR